MSAPCWSMRVEAETGALTLGQIVVDWDIRGDVAKPVYRVLPR